MELGDLGTAATAKGDLTDLALTKGDKCDLSSDEEGAKCDKEED
jgi:hypothetical protein